jgi:hypothetical protein
LKVSERSALIPPTGASNVGEERERGEHMVDVLQLNLALWGMIVCAEIKIEQWVQSIF